MININFNTTRIVKKVPHTLGMREPILNLKFLKKPYISNDTLDVC
jgi:hypothetical protein